MTEFQLSVFNKNVNREVTYAEERAGEDYWQLPHETEMRGTGDCEDIAILKYCRLMRLGFKPRLVYCMYLPPHVAKPLRHMVCELDGLVLDNLIDMVEPWSRRYFLTPVFWMNHEGYCSWNSDEVRPVAQYSKWHLFIARLGPL